MCTQTHAASVLLVVDMVFTACSQESHPHNIIYYASGEVWIAGGFHILYRYLRICLALYEGWEHGLYFLHMYALSSLPSRDSECWCSLHVCLFLGSIWVSCTQTPLFMMRTLWSIWSPHWGKTTLCLVLTTHFPWANIILENSSSQLRAGHMTQRYCSNCQQ